MNNWNKRSSYLLTEIVKYELYIDSLEAAMKERLKRRGEKALDRDIGKWVSRRRKRTQSRRQRNLLRPALRRGSTSTEEKVQVPQRHFRSYIDFYLCFWASVVLRHFAWGMYICIYVHAALILIFFSV